MSNFARILPVGAELFHTDRQGCLCNKEVMFPVRYGIMVGSRRLMPSDALQPKAYCTNPGL